MGCLSVGLAALLALAVPASIAPASLPGAYVVLAILAGVAVVAVLANARRPQRKRVDGVPVQRSRALAAVAALAVAYAVVVTVIHISAT